MNSFICLLQRALMRTKRNDKCSQILKKVLIVGDTHQCVQSVVVSVNRTVDRADKVPALIKLAFY